MECREVFERMSEKFEELRVNDVYGVFQFNIDGHGGGSWHAVCEGDSCKVREGRFMKPDVTLSADANDVVKLAEGRMNPLLALARRKIKIKGDVRLMAKIQSKLLGSL